MQKNASFKKKWPVEMKLKASLAKAKTVRLTKNQSKNEGNFRKLDYEHLFYNEPDKTVRKGIFVAIKSYATRA